MQIKNYKIFIRSLVSFCIALVVCSVVLEYKHLSKKSSGRGGFESPEMPVFREDLSDKELLLPKSIESALSYQAYRVEQGDMISVIAERFGITQDTIISVNNIRQSRLIQIGQYLKIPNMPGILYSARTSNESIESIAKKYNVDAIKCANVNNLSEDSILADGQTIFIPDAELDWVTRQEINGDLFLKPVKYYYLSSSYGWRASPFSGQRSFHTGIDMAAPLGTSVTAALVGKVVDVGYNSVYGNYIIISHHSGYRTLYGHLSAQLVVVGQSVTTSTRIGKVGSTGLSTGPHLHFTVYKNGRTVNPLNLLK